MRTLSVFGKARAGNMMMMVAILLPLLIGVVGAGIDYARLFLFNQSLQEAADSAALAGARQFVIANGQSQVPENVAQNVAQIGVDRSSANGATIQATADNSELSVTVEITHFFRPTFLVALYKSPLTLSVTSTAIATGAAKVCVIGLQDTGDNVVQLTDKAKLSANSCAVFSNSIGKKALASTSSAELISAMACSAGGIDGTAGNFTPMATSDCPPREDPLATRAEPTPPAGCDHTNYSINASGGEELEPGVYCGGIDLNASFVTFKPGLYFIKDGPLKASGWSKLEGVDVGFFFYGDSAALEIAGSTEVDLHAPVTGDMAGILFWRAKGATGNNVFRITSKWVYKMVGTIYLPGGKFLAEIPGAGGKISEGSAYTAIIADIVTVKKTTNLILNTDYNATPVPVPAGMTGSGGSVRLRD